MADAGTNQGQREKDGFTPSPNQESTHVVEVWAWLCVNWCTYGATGSMVLAVSGATLSGVFAVVMGQILLLLAISI